MRLPVRELIVSALLLSTSAGQLPPPNLLANGDARAGKQHWVPRKNHQLPTREQAKDATIEDCDGVPCFVVRNGMAWQQHIRLLEDFSGKYVLIIATGSAERVHADDNITGRPYLWARLWTDPPAMVPGTILQGMHVQPRVPNQWSTMFGVFPVPKGIVSMDVMLGQGERKGTPQNGSAARVRDVEVRFFDTEAAARAYVTIYEAAHDTGR